MLLFLEEFIGRIAARKFLSKFTMFLFFEKFNTYLYCTMWSVQVLNLVI